MDETDHLRLAGVTRLSLRGRGPKDAFIFDPHRLAFPCWALGLADTRPGLLVTLDRHLDLVPPSDVTAIPDAQDPLRQLDEFARWSLDVRNYDHVLAAMEAGIIKDAIVIARAKPRGALERTEYVDRRGEKHRILAVPTIDRLADGFAGVGQSPEAREAETLIREARSIVLDVDLDCFTTTSDADPTEVVPWPRELIRRMLVPPESGPFWDAVLFKTKVLTIAREPLHCGGVIASHRLFDDLAGVLFVELLRTDLP
ncbi:MAG: UPF0489 family protein [Myxococcaceae bacterium]|nr:UPF0489 family protein [Myxococcaceae bacterium]